jgi:hypothetical protein
MGALPKKEYCAASKHEFSAEGEREREEKGLRI